MIIIITTQCSETCWKIHLTNRVASVIIHWFIMRESCDWLVVILCEIVTLWNGKFFSIFRLNQIFQERESVVAARNVSIQPTVNSSGLEWTRVDLSFNCQACTHLLRTFCLGGVLNCWVVFRYIPFMKTYYVQLSFYLQTKASKKN